MAKRLNKKVALIGTAVLLAMFIVFFVVVQEKDILTSQAKLIEDGDAAVAKQDYETARLKYLRARSRAKDDQVRLTAINRLVDVYLETEDWPPLLGVWQEILNIEPNNLAVRYARLKYLYILADSGVVQLWQDIEKQASDFLGIVERDNLLNQDTAQWEKPQYEKVGLVHPSISGADGVQRIGQYLYLLKGRGKLEMVSSGSVTEPDRILEEAVQDLEKAQELEPTNTLVAWYLARAFIERGDLLASRGSFDERKKARQAALEILEKAAEDSPQDARGQMNLLVIRQNIAIMENETLETLASFEPQYRQLVEKFPNEPSVYSFIASYYRGMGPTYLNQALESAEKARELEPNNITYVISAADSYNLKATIEDSNLALAKATSILNDALKLPGVQETRGPQRHRHMNNRASVYMYLGTMYLERLLAPEVDLAPQQRQEWIGKAEGIVHEIEQILGSGEDPTVMKWQGMLALAKGNRTEAIQKLYAVYQRLKASKRMDTQLAYVLAKTFENTSELGAASDFYVSALRLREEDRRNRSDSVDRRKPSAMLDLSRILLRLGAAGPALTTVNFFENIYGANSQSHALKLIALSAAGNFEDAEAALAEGGMDLSEQLKLEAQLLQRRITDAEVKIERQHISEDSNAPGEVPAVETKPVNVSQLEKQIQSDNDRLAQDVTKLLSIDPNSMSDFIVLNVCRGCQKQGKEDKARELANLFLGVFPENTAVRTYLKVLEKGGEITAEEEAEIRRGVIEEISDPDRRAFEMGMFYAQQEEPNEAAVEFRKVLDAFEAKANELTDDDMLSRWARIAGSYLFGFAVGTKNLDMAQEIVGVAQRYNLDQYNGDYFKARLALAKQEYKQALQIVEQCVKQWPVSSQILILRGQIKEALGRTGEAITDMKQAAYFNPLDSNINKILAVALFKRNAALGNNVTTDQFIEAKEAIERAIATNKSDLELLSFYAGYISESEPQNALAIRQRIFQISPDVDNAVLLGNMAFKIAQNKTDENEKQALMEIASRSYQEALKLDPSSQIALSAYAQFCRATGRPDEAEQIIGGSGNESLRWRYYLDAGKYEKAKEIMERLYIAQPENEQLLMGLLNIAQRTGNQDDAKKYSEALCKVNDSVNNNLIQIQVYLSVGLISEAQLKLDSFREKNPDDPIGQLLNAALLMKQGKREEALELANKGLENDPTNARGWLLRGGINRLFMDSDHIQQAINDLLKSKSLDDNSDVRVALAIAYLAAGRATDAAMELTTIIDEPKTSDQARLLLEHIYALSGNQKTLQSFYERMMDKFPDNMMWTMKAASFAVRLGDFETAQRLYLHAWNAGVEQGKPNISALDSYITALVRGDKLQEALDVSAKYLDSEFETAALMGMGMAKAKMNDREAARQFFIKAADRESQNPLLVANILNVMYHLVGPNEVRDYCNQKLAEDPNSVVANYVLYNVAKLGGDYNKAAAFMDKCIAISEPNSQGAMNLIIEKATLLAAAYQTYSDNNYCRQALDAWLVLLQKAPDNVSVLNNVAYLMVQDNEKADKALEYANKAVQLSPDNPEVIDTYAYVLYYNSRFDEAAERARAALQLYEAQEATVPAEVYQHLGMIMDALGNKDEALAAYQKALELGVDSLSDKSKEQIKEAVKKLGN